MSHQPVAEFALERVSRDARESVRATTLQSYAELAYWHFLAHVLTRLLVEVAEYLHASLYLVAVHFLSDEQLDAVLVVVAKGLHEVVWLVVLTS